MGLLQVHMKEREKGLVPPELHLLFLKLVSVTPPLCTKLGVGMGGGIYTGMHGLLQIHTHEREGDGLGTP